MGICGKEENTCLKGFGWEETFWKSGGGGGRGMGGGKWENEYLCEPDIRCLFPETLPADVERVFSDQTCFVGADTAVLYDVSCVSLFLGWGWVFSSGSPPLLFLEGPGY